MSDLARKFHDIYERLAPTFGYETRKETREFDPDSPNGKLMAAVCAEVSGEQQDTIERLTAALAAAEKRIAEAPHSMKCASIPDLRNDKAHLATYPERCDCWKAALREEGDDPPKGRWMEPVL